MLLVVPLRSFHFQLVVCSRIAMPLHCAARGAHRLQRGVKRAGIGPKQQPPRMSTDEKRLVREMHFDRGMTATEISEVVGRHLSCVCRLLAQRKAPNPIGCPRALSESQVDRLVQTLEGMVNKADANYEVTIRMLMRRCRLRVCDRVVCNALHVRGYWFRGLRSKLILTPEDVQERIVLGKKFKHRSKQWWLKTVHSHLDNHHFKRATTCRGRKLLAKRRVRGVYRLKGKSLKPGHVRPSPSLRVQTGGKGFLKLGGVGDGRVLVWKTILGTWSSQTSATMYRDVVAPALKKHYPGASKFLIMEDNDPTGNTSRKAVAEKRAQRMQVLTMPKRSPDLNVLDFAVWSRVESLMRAQERKMKADKHETRTQFENRLDRTAKSLPAAFINASIGNLQKRCQLLIAAKGGLFEEGGRSRRPL